MKAQTSKLRFPSRMMVMSTALVALMALSLFLTLQVSANLPASKHAAAASSPRVIYEMDESNPTLYEAVPLLSQPMYIKTAEQKDLVISVSAEIVLFTDTKIQGKGTKDLDDQDMASVKVWVEVDGEPAFPDIVTFAERIQTLKGRLSAVVHDEYGNWANMPEEVELILETTSANSFNFIVLDLESGVHEINVYATIELSEASASGEVSANPWAALGHRTVIVQEIRLIKDS